MVLMKRFANLPNNLNNASVELHPRVTPIDDDDQIMITDKLTSIHS
jgi:hypothetical protein